jgi:mRNA-degrading endonuclease RelE of RelBE toxin-antitoxin system
MASYSIDWKESALKELSSLPKPMIARVVSAVDALANEPFSPGVVKLKGSDHVYR